MHITSYKYDKVLLFVLNVYRRLCAHKTIFYIYVYVHTCIYKIIFLYIRLIHTYEVNTYLCTVPLTVLQQIAHLFRDIAHFLNTNKSTHGKNTTLISSLQHSLLKRYSLDELFPSRCFNTSLGFLLTIK